MSLEGGRDVAVRALIVQSINLDGLAGDGGRVDNGDFDDDGGKRATSGAERLDAAAQVARQQEGIAKDDEGARVGGVVWLGAGVDDDGTSRRGRRGPGDALRKESVKVTEESVKVTKAESSPRKSRSSPRTLLARLTVGGSSSMAKADKRGPTRSFSKA